MKESRQSSNIIFIKNSNPKHISQFQMKINIKKKYVSFKKKYSRNACSLLFILTVVAFFFPFCIISNIKNKNLTYDKQKKRRIESSQPEKSNIFNLLSLKSDNPVEEFESYIHNENLISKLKDYKQYFSVKCPNSMIDRLFLNGLIRRYRPKKLVEIGVLHGCTSVVMLNAIKDIKDAFLYSIDLLQAFEGVTVGHLVQEIAPELKYKWKLYTGGISCKFLEKIGKGIELTFIDTMHTLPGEILDFLQVLPFLSENALLTLHGVDYGFRTDLEGLHKKRTSNNLLFLYLKGKKIYPIPNQKDNYFHGTSCVLLDTNQKQYYFEYFYATTIQWHYILPEYQYTLMDNFFKKYYDESCVKLFEEAYRRHHDAEKKKYIERLNYI